MLLIAIAAAAAQPSMSSAWASFSRIGMASEVVEVSSLFGRDTGRLEYRLRLTIRRVRGRKPEVKWADSIACPAVRRVVLGMHDLTMPSPAPYGGPDNKQVVVLDGAEYSLTAPSSYMMGKLTITSTDETPLAAWVDGAFQQLATCWRASKDAR